MLSTPMYCTGWPFEESETVDSESRLNLRLARLIFDNLVRVTFWLKDDPNSGLPNCFIVFMPLRQNVPYLATLAMLLLDRTDVRVAELASPPYRVRGTSTERPRCGPGLRQAALVCPSSRQWVSWTTWSRAAVACVPRLRLRDRMCARVSEGRLDV